SPRKAEGELAERLRVELRKRGASFFADLQAATGAFPADLLKALWDLVWAGEVTNDTLAPLRSYLRGAPKEDRRVPHLGRPFRSRRIGPSGSEGRWSLLPQPAGTPTERAAALARALADQVDWGRRKALLIARVDGEDVNASPLAPALKEAGFTAGIKGYLKRAPLLREAASPEPAEALEEEDA